MSGTVLSFNPAINRGLLSALLPMTFIQDFHIQHSEIICYFTKNYEEILPQVQTFLDAIGEIAETQFYFEMQTSRIGALKIYDTEPLTLNEHLLFENNIDCELKKNIIQ
ncbi:hypothetical protein CEE45_10180 [Candidatus Heimdallarchaeota archaeon B3_Heim]|nr:MAG: hypothetical protein CEE45_10180 [Candidatus Heimdallarchaeota archaeon B3_Heim]